MALRSSSAVEWTGVALLIAQLGGCAASGSQLMQSGATTRAAPKSAQSAPKNGADAQASAETVQLGDAAWQAGDLDRAVYYYLKSMQATPPVAATLAKVGAIEEGRRNLALAAKAFEMAHVADPRDLRIAERLGRLYLQQGNIDGAGLLFASVVADEPESPRALDGMGEVHLVRGDYRQAIRFFDRALHSSGVDRATVLTHRGHAALNLDDVAAAESDLKAAIGIAPRPDTWRHLAELEVRRGNNAAALECLSNVMDLSRSYNEIGLLLLKHSNHRAAADYFAKAVSAAPSWYEEANRNLAVANEHLGNRPK